MARVHLQAPVVVADPTSGALLDGGGVVGTQVVLQPAEQGVGLGDVDGGGGRGDVGEQAAQLAGVAAERCQQRMGDQVGRAVVVARDHAAEVGEVVPQRGRRLRQPDVDVAVLAEGLEQGDLGDRQPGVPEQREPVRECESVTADA